MTVSVVTGGAGFVGGHLVDALLDAGDDVRVLDVVDPSDVRDRHDWLDVVDYMQGSVTDPDLIDTLLDGADRVLHLASLVGVPHYVDDPMGVIDVNVVGSRRLFERATRQDVRVLYTSTSEIFGKNPDVPWPEDGDRVLGPTSLDRWSYSTSKALCEHMLYALGRSDDLRFTIVRYFNLYGPGQPPRFVVPAMIDRVVSGEPPMVLDGGTQTRCFTYVEDAIEATMMAIESEAAVGEAFNVGNPVETRIVDLAETILEVADAEELGLVHRSSEEVYGETYEDLDRRVPSVEKARETLGWEAKTDLREGLRRTIGWFRRRRGVSPGA